MSAKAGSPPDRSWWTMFIIQVVPLLGGTDTTMSPLRHSIFCCIVSLIHGGGPAGGPFCPASCVGALTRSPLDIRGGRATVRHANTSGSRLAFCLHCNGRTL